MSGPAASASVSKFSAFMNHPAGPKTVFFWAPLMKWCLVAAGLKDLSRPADKLSVSQNLGEYILLRSIVYGEDGWDEAGSIGN